MNCIETRYRGYRFRSRLEARWAVFLDCMEEPWEYEKEGFILPNGDYYLPDFWLPDQHVWLEIKGEQPDDTAHRRAELLRDETDHAVAIFHGLPGEYCGTLYCWDLGDSSGGSSCWEVSLANQWEGAFCFWVETNKELYTDPCMEHPIELCNACVKVDMAAECARAIRFEHGQNPMDEWFRMLREW